MHCCARSTEIMLFGKHYLSMALLTPCWAQESLQTCLPCFQQNKAQVHVLPLNKSKIKQNPHQRASTQNQSPPPNAWTQQKWKLKKQNNKNKTMKVRKPKFLGCLSRSACLTSQAWRTHMLIKVGHGVESLRVISIEKYLPLVGTISNGPLTLKVPLVGWEISTAPWQKIWVTMYAPYHQDLSLPWKSHNHELNSNT